MNQKTKNYLFLAMFFVLLAVIIFIGFKIWTQFILLNLFNIKNFPPFLFYLFAILAGLISFFAPCAIGIIPAYAAYYLELKENSENTKYYSKFSKENKFKHAFKMGSIAASGIFVLYFTLGLLLTIFGTSFARYFSISKPIIAFILLIIGVVLIINYSFKNNYLYRLINKKIIRGKVKNNLFFFGILYGAAALGCAMLVFVPLVIIPIATGNFFTGLFSFILYSAAFGFSMIVTTILVAYSKHILVEKIAASSQIIKKITGIILILSAIYLSYYFMRYSM